MLPGGPAWELTRRLRPLPACYWAGQTYSDLRRLHSWGPSPSLTCRIECGIQTALESTALLGEAWLSYLTLDEIWIIHHHYITHGKLTDQRVCNKLLWLPEFLNISWRQWVHTWLVDLLNSLACHWTHDDHRLVDNSYDLSPVWLPNCTMGRVVKNTSQIDTENTKIVMVGRHHYH